MSTKTELAVFVDITSDGVMMNMGSCHGTDNEIADYVYFQMVGNEGDNDVTLWLDSIGISKLIKILQEELPVLIKAELKTLITR